MFLDSWIFAKTRKLAFLDFLIFAEIRAPTRKFYVQHLVDLGLVISDIWV